MYAQAKLSRRLANLAAVLLLVSPAVGQWTEDAKLVPPAAGPDTGWGGAVSISGDRAAVAANLDSRAARQAGAVYVFARQGGNWLEEAVLTAADAAAYDDFGYAIALFNDILVVGAPGDNAAGTDSGSTYVFRRTPGGWVQEAKLVPADGASFDAFGSAVAAGADWVLIGAPLDDDQAQSSGSAYFFAFDGSTWLEMEKVTASDAASDHQFGTSVAMDGAVAIVGAPFNGAGAAYVFRDDGAAWTEAAKLAATDGQSGARFGAAAAVRGNTALVGAPRFSDSEGVNRGAAYLFTFDGDRWRAGSRLTASNPSASDFFGSSLALEADGAVIGAHLDDDGGVNAGAAYVFRAVGGEWTETLKMTAGDAVSFGRFGLPVAMDGDQVLVGAGGADDGGAAYVITLPPPNSAPISDAGGDYVFACDAAQGPITLSAAGSQDPDGDLLTYRWKTECPGVAFTNPTGVTTQLRFKTTPEYGFSCRVLLSVSDGVNPPVYSDAMVMMADTSPPVLSAPALVHVTLGSATNPSVIGAPEIQDCDPHVHLSYRDSKPKPLYDADGGEVGQAFSRLWVAQDGGENRATFKQTIVMTSLVFALDVQPGVCPNTHDPYSGEGLIVALAGQPGFDLGSIDVSSIRLSRTDGVGAAVAPRSDVGDLQPSGAADSADNAEPRSEADGLQPDQADDGAEAAEPTLEPGGVLPSSTTHLDEAGEPGLAPGDIRPLGANTFGQGVARKFALSDARPSLVDVTALADTTDCACSAAEPDGIADLVLSFDASALEEALALTDASPAYPVELVLTCVISDPGSPLDGLPITARDCVEVLSSGGGDAESPSDAAGDLPLVPGVCGTGVMFAFSLSLTGLALMRGARRRW